MSCCVRDLAEDAFVGLQVVSSPSQKSPPRDRRNQPIKTKESSCLANAYEPWFLLSAASVITQIPHPSNET